MEMLTEPRICGSEDDLVDYVYLYIKDSGRLGVTEATDLHVGLRKLEMRSGELYYTGSGESCCHWGGNACPWIRFWGGECQTLDKVLGR